MSSREYMKKYRKRNRHRIALTRKKYARKNKKRIASVIKKWRVKNVLRLKKYRQEYVSKHKQKVKSWGVNWRNHNKQRIKENSRKWRALNKKELKKYRIRHAVRYRLLGKKSSAKHRENLSNMYMKRIFREVYGVRQVPEVVLEAKRNHLHVLRLLRGD